jgi:hypothetical protein
MWLKNETRFPTERIREIVEFTRPAGIDDFSMTVSYYSGPSEIPYDGETFPDRGWIFVSIPTQASFKRHAKDVAIRSTDELLVKIIAHELRHLQQKNLERHDPWQANGEFRERDADGYALHKVRAWRLCEEL